MVLKDEQIAILCNIGQSIAFADDKHGQVEKLIVEGYVMKDGDLYELTPKGLKVVEEHAALFSAQRSRDSSA
jgi:predicted transcriptional regulator